MKSIKLEVDESIYNHIMFILKNLNVKGLNIKEEKNEHPGKSTKESMVDLFKSKDFEVFESISDPLEWQRNQRDGWR